MTTTMTKNKAKTKTQEAATTQSGIDSISKGSLAAMIGVSAFVGVWGTACFVSAFFSSSSPVALVKSWFSALIGM